MNQMKKHKLFRQDFDEEDLEQGPLIKPTHKKSQSCPFELPDTYSKFSPGNETPIFQSELRTEKSRAEDRFKTQRSQVPFSEQKRASQISQSSHSNCSVVIHQNQADGHLISSQFYSGKTSDLLRPEVLAKLLPCQPIGDGLSTRWSKPRILHPQEGEQLSKQLKNYVNIYNLELQISHAQSKKRNLILKRQVLKKLMKMKAQPPAEDSGFFSGNDFFFPEIKFPKSSNKDLLTILGERACDRAWLSKLQQFSAQGKKLLLQLKSGILGPKKISSVQVYQPNEQCLWQADCPSRRRRSSQVKSVFQLNKGQIVSSKSSEISASSIAIQF